MPRASLEKDPHELREISDSMGLWRERLAKHLAVRGREWVLDGKLVARPKRQLYSPNYPR